MSFHRNGQLATAILARDHPSDEVGLPGASLVGFGTDGRLQSWSCTLEAPRVLAAQGIDGPCEVGLAAGTDVVVEGGKLRAATLRATTRVDIWEFPEGTGLTGGDSGALSHAALPVPWTLHGVPWAPGETVVFLYGRIQEGWPVDDGVFEGVPYQGGEVLRFDDGSPSLVTLAQPFDAHPMGSVLRYEASGAPPRVEPASVPRGPVTPLVE